VAELVRIKVRDDVVNEYNLMVAINAASSVILVGASMGGLDALLTAAKGNLPAGKLKGIYLIDAVTDLKWAYTGNANAFQSSINTAYSLTTGTLSGATGIGVTSLPTTASYPTIGTQIVIAPGTGSEEKVTTTGASTGTAVAVTATVAAHASADLISDFPTKTSGNDPRNNFAASAYTGLRMRFFASTADVTVAKASNTDPFQTFVAASVTESAIVTHNASTHTQVGPGKDFTDFLSRCV
jgi:pimeloyl-ACP methyl ester carboxylesterase